MNIKFDTKEKFHIITLQDPTISANMTAELSDLLLPLLQSNVKNVIINLNKVQTIDEAAAETLVKIQQNFYENKSSFVICGLNETVETFLEKTNLLKMMNVTPTESEAWDIVQMEEIEREFMDEEDF